MGNSPPPPSGDDATKLIRPGAALPPPKPNKMMGGYELLRPLGEGGMGFVYLARDIELQREVALKVVRAELASNEQFNNRFMREARLCAALNHPNIVSTFSVGKHEGVPFLVLELVEGKTLRQLLQTPPPLSLEDALEIISQCLDGLEAAAKRRIVHRDIKPANIMVRTDGLVKLMDFGLSREVHSEKMTMTSTILGTPDYMSPEQARGEDVDFRTDIYALGITLFQCVTGYLPYKSSSVFETIRMHAEEPLPDDPRLQTIAGGRLLRLIERMTAKDAGDRPSSHKEIREELRRIRGQIGSEGTISLPQGDAAAGQLDWQRGVTPSRDATPSTSPNRPVAQQRSSGSQPLPAAPRREKSNALLIVAGLVGVIAIALGATWAAGGFDSMLQRRPAAPSATPVAVRAQADPNTLTSLGSPATVARQASRTGVASGPFTHHTTAGTMVTMGDMLRLLGNFGVNHLVTENMPSMRTRGAVGFRERDPRDVLTLMAMANGWDVELSNDLYRLRTSGQNGPSRIAASRMGMRVDEIPLVSVSTHSDTRLTLRLVLDAIRRDTDFDYLIVGSRIAEAPVPSLSLNRQPLSILMEAMGTTGLPYAWTWERGTLVVLGQD